MRSMKAVTLLVTALALTASLVNASSDSDTTKLFRNADQSADYFRKSVGCAVFPTIGKDGLGLGAAHGTGNVYAGGKRIGNVSMNQLSIGFRAGGQAYSQINFFADKHALKEFTSGNFEFSADVGAIAKGGLMYNATVAGQKCSYQAR